MERAKHVRPQPSLPAWTPPPIPPTPQPSLAKKPLKKSDPKRFVLGNIVATLMGFCLIIFGAVLIAIHPDEGNVLVGSFEILVGLGAAGSTVRALIKFSEQCKIGKVVRGSILTILMWFVFTMGGAVLAALHQRLWMVVLGVIIFLLGARKTTFNCAVLYYLWRNT